MMDWKHDQKVRCYDCKREFQLKLGYKVEHIDFDVWKCPHCGWANSKKDLGLTK